MKILFFSGIPVDDGATMYRSGVLARNFQKRGHQVIFTSVDRNFKGIQKLEIENLEITFLGQAHYFAKDKLSVRKKLGMGKAVLENLKTSIRLVKIILKEKPDRILVVASMPVSLMVGVISRTLRYWTTIDVEDYAVGQMETSEYSKSLISIYKAIERLGLKSFNQVIVCSHYLQQQYPGSKIIPNFVDCEFWNNHKRVGGGNKIFFIGQIGIYHGQFEALEGLADFLRREKKYKLFFVGSGEKMEELKQKVKNFNLGSQVVFTGQIMQAEIRDLYTPGDIGLLPLWDKPVHQARHPLKLIEYLAAGLIVMTNQVGEAALIIKDGENGFLCPTGDLRCIISKIKRVTTNKKIREKIVKNAQLTAKQFDLDPIVDQWSRDLLL